MKIKFSWKEDKIRIISQKTIEMVCPPSDTIKYDKNQSGFWVELQDKEHGILYRRVTRNPIQRDIEIFSDEKTESISRKAIDINQGEFEILVPFMPEAKTLVLYGSISKEEESLKPARIIAEFSLEDQLRPHDYG